LETEKDASERSLTTTFWFKAFWRESFIP